MIAGRDLWTA